MFKGSYGHLKFDHFLPGFTCRRLGLLYLWQYVIQYIALQSSTAQLESQGINDFY